MRFTRAATKREAIVTAIAEYNRLCPCALLARVTRGPACP